MKAYILLWKVQIFTNILLRRQKNAYNIWMSQKNPKGKVKRIIIFRTESKSPMWQKILSRASLGTWEECSQYGVKMITVVLVHRMKWVRSDGRNLPSTTSPQFKQKKKILAFIKFVVLLTEYMKHVTMMLHSIVYKLLVILNAKSFAFFAILGKSLALYSFIVTYTTENNFCCVKFQGCHIC